MNDSEGLPRAIPENLINLHRVEEFLWKQACGEISDDPRMALHLVLVEHAMDLADLLRQQETEDENLKVVQMLAMRAFNAFAASLKLAMSGYGQNSALVMRDILETVFLLDLFKSNNALVEQWRRADKKERLGQFSPVRVREALDRRDGFTTKKRAEMYDMFSELAGHPNMNSILMLRPGKNSDAVVGPFIDADSLNATLAEMGRLACQFGEILSQFFLPEHGQLARHSFASVKIKWLSVFYGKPRPEKR